MERQDSKTQGETMNFSTFDSIFNPNFLHRNETSLVNLELMNGDEKVQQVIYGRDYKLKAHFSRPDGKETLNSLNIKPKYCDFIN